MTNCPACLRVERARPGTDPFLIAEFEQTFAVLHKHQPYLAPAGGWCTLWLKEHSEHFGLLSGERQAVVMREVALISRVMHRALPGLRRINYECLGNVVPHVHWHLIPRFEAPFDPDPGATVWVRPAAELECGVSDEVRDRLVAMLKREIGR